MVVEFECRTWLPVDVHDAFDLSRSIDLHVSSMAASGERAVGPYLRQLIERRNAHLLPASVP
jgi:hypothetical protein